MARRAARRPRSHRQPFTEPRDRQTHPQTDKSLADLASSLDSWQDTDIGPLALDLQRSVHTPPPDPIPDTFRITHTRPHTWYGDEGDIPALSHALSPSHSLHPPSPSPSPDLIFRAFALFRLLSLNHHLHSIPSLTSETPTHQTTLAHARCAAHYLINLLCVWKIDEMVIYDVVLSWRRMGYNKVMS